MIKSLTLFGRSAALPVRFQQKFGTVQNNSWKLISASVVLSVACAVLLFWYLLGANSFSAEGYAIKHIQTSISQIAAENKKLALKVSEQSSIATVQAQLESSQYVPVVQAKFVQVPYFTQR